MNGLNPLYTGVAMVERSLSTEKMVRSLNDLSKSAQRSPWDRQDLSMISQWSANDLHGHHGLRYVLTESKAISHWSLKGSDLSMKAQWVFQWKFNERARTAQQSHRSLSDLSAIFPRMPIFCTPKERWLRNQWAHKDLTQKRPFHCFWEIIERSGPFLIAQWSPNDLRPV